MRHRIRGRKLGRKTAPREALIRGLARAIILNEEGRIVTTISKAKEVKPFVEKLVTLARKGEEYRRRRAFKLLHDKEAVTKLFEEFGPRYKERNGGYTRIIRWDKRLGDKAEKAILEFVVDDETAITPDSETTVVDTTTNDSVIETTAAEKPVEEITKTNDDSEESTSEDKKTD